MPRQKLFTQKKQCSFRWFFLPLLLRAREILSLSTLTFRIRINAIGDGIKSLICVIVKFVRHLIIVIRIVDDAAALVERIEFVVVLGVRIVEFMADIFDVVVVFLDVVDVRVATVMVLLRNVMMVLSMVVSL